jgi:hypothetical protein
VRIIVQRFQHSIFRQIRCQNWAVGRNRREKSGAPFSLLFTHVGAGQNEVERRHGSAATTQRQHSSEDTQRPAQRNCNNAPRVCLLRCVVGP